MTQSTTRSIRRALLCLFALLVPLTLPAATINVPSTATPTIQSGIDASANGDTVLVAPGTYYENIDFKGKAITVTSGSAANVATTIIDGGNNAPAVRFTSGETRSSVLSYLTIQHGGVYATSLDVTVNGGVLLFQATPTILGNVLTQNACWSINSIDSSPLIQGNTISATRDPDGNCELAGGSAIFAFGDQPPLSAMIIGNILEDNVESGNEKYRVDNGGAGVAVWGGNPVIAKNIIRNNVTSGGTGAAIHLQEGGNNSIVIVQNLIYGNLSGCGGGAIATEGNDLIANNTIVDNVFASSGSNLPECANIAQIYPAPVGYGYTIPNDEFVNNIIAGSTAAPTINAAYRLASATEDNQPIFDHNLFYNARGLVFGTNYIDVSAKYGNIVADPQFVDQAHHDYHLKSTSPAIDAGNTSVLQSLEGLIGSPVSTDFDNNPRLQDSTGKGYPIIDMGAYEYAGHVNASDTTMVLTSSAYYVASGKTCVLTATLVSALGVPTGSVNFFLDGKQIGTSTIGNDGTATLTNFPATAGVHSLYADYAGSGSFTPAHSVIIIVQFVDTNATTISIASTPNPSLLDQAVTFTVSATSSDSSFVPSPIALYLNGGSTPLTSLTPNASGVATYTTSSLPLGKDTVTANFAGDASHNSASDSIEQDVISAYPTTTSLTIAPTTAIYGTSIAMTATVNFSGTPNYSGGITFMDGTTAIVVGGLLPGSSTMSVNYAYLAVGTHSITAVYSGDPTHSSSTSAPIVVTITAATTTLGLTATPSPGFALQPITLAAKLAEVPTGSVAGNLISFFANGKAIGTANTNAQGTATLTATLPTGTYSLTAVFAGTTGVAGSTSPVVSKIVNPNPATAALFAQPNPGYQGGNETLAATIATLFTSSGTPPVPTGTVTFLDAGVVIATANLDANGQATFSTTTFTVGRHPLTAVYNGTGNFLPATSMEYTLAISPRDFTLTTDSTITIQTEHHKDLDFTLASIGDFTDTIVLSCGNLPTYASCTFANNGPLLAAGAAQASNVHVDTDALLNYLSSRNSPPLHTRLRGGAAIALTLPVILIATMRRRRSLHRVLGVLVLLIATTLTGCSGHYPGHTPPGSYTFTIKGEGLTSHVTHAANLTLIVTE